MALRTLAVDFNSFFASCEQQERPELRGKPIAIVPVMAETTSCIAASYPAKACGVKVGTGVAEARRLCPDIQFVQQRPKVYISYHRRLLQVIESCIHISAVHSIDEVACELTSTFAPREKALAVARKIKSSVAREVGPMLSCSIGIAPNWMIAKMATDMQKPDGLVVIDESDLPQRLLGLQITDFIGIGPRMDLRLRAAGIDTPARLYEASKAQLRGVWGSVEGERIYEAIRGREIPAVAVSNQTIGHSHVLPPKFRTTPGALSVMHRLLQKAAMRLRSIDHYAGSLGISLDYLDGYSWRDELRLTETQDTIEMTSALSLLWARGPGKLRPGGPLRVGVLLGRLRPSSCHTPDLFYSERNEARQRLFGAVDEVNRVFGNGSVYFAGAHGATDTAPMRISFTTIPKPEDEEVDESRAGRLRGAPESPPRAAEADNGGMAPVDDRADL